MLCLPLTFLYTEPGRNKLLGTQCVDFGRAWRPVPGAVAWGPFLLALTGFPPRGPVTSWPATSSDTHPGCFHFRFLFGDCEQSSLERGYQSFFGQTFLVYEGRMPLSGIAGFEE